MSFPAVTGSAADLALAGLADRDGAGVTVSLREARRPTAGLWVHWAVEPLAGDDERPDRLIAPVGPDAWRNAPWPVSDAIFELPPPEPGAGVLVCGEQGFREDVLGKMQAGDSAITAERLTAEALSAAAVVVLASRHDTLAAEAMSVLAARRVLVSGPCERRFGLEPGIELMHADTRAEAAVFAELALHHWRAFDTMRVLGAIAAERHRASLVYPRLVEDLELEGALPKGV